MPRYLRYVVIWLSCTAVSVTAVMLTVGFVVGSTRPTPPVARDIPESALAGGSPSPARPSPSRVSSQPRSHREEVHDSYTHRTMRTKEA
ncbi:hypothetical protein PV350_42390, partial [Streptomyces sp. PA03-6a]|nr:hypothetical protein [Streptomyces sp. PA03-6a]